MMHSEIEEPGNPSGVAIIGSDDSVAHSFMLYFDERAVSRKYEVTLRDNVWKWWREDPSFSQRFTAKILDDGRTMIAEGQMSRDGSSWEKDLELRYTRAD